MGRYYKGDIKGKFWFGVQKSNDADFFGVEGIEPNYLESYFDSNNLKSITEGIEKCQEELGKYKVMIDNYFEKNNGYNDTEMAKELKITEVELKNYLEWYARLKLGEKIFNCVTKNGSCEFTAEC